MKKNQNNLTHTKTFKITLQGLNKAQYRINFAAFGQKFTAFGTNKLPNFDPIKRNKKPKKNPKTTPTDYSRST